MTLKGKEVAGKDRAGKRKVSDENDRSGGGRKRRNHGVLQFFEDIAAEVDDSDFSDDSDFDDDFMEEDFNTGAKVNNEPAKAQSLPFILKEEEMDEEDFDKMMEERYKDGARILTYAGDDFEKKSIDRDSVVFSSKDPTIWKVKCMVGRERHSAFCLMQKFVDLKSLGTELRIISAFSVDHIKGFIYIEAEKQCDVNEACKGLSGIYITRVLPVPKNEISHLLSVRTKCNEVSEGMWTRVKNGKYKGDLAQVVAVNNSRKKATVKLIPRIDLQAMAAKFGGGIRPQKAAAPAPRFISSSELDEFRPLIQYRRDRDTGKFFEILDGLMLKDGYLYKKVSLDSLNLWNVFPTEEELLKFNPSQSNETNDLEWLSQLFGNQKKQRIVVSDKGGGKGEGSSGSSISDGFELHDLVCFSRKDYGVIIGREKDDSYKILKDSQGGPVAVTIQRRDLKSVLDIKLRAEDLHRKTVLVNDTVRVLEGPSKGKQGIVKKIYRGTIFLYDEREEENGGYFCSKSHMCEKIMLSVGDFAGKDNESGLPGFEDFSSSPKSPLSPKKPWQARENNREFNRGDKDGLFSIGQTLRIKVGPLKGYLCRVLAIRRTDVTVKLDSQQKVLTVRCEHLAEVQGRGIALSTRDADASSSQAFDLLGSEGGSGGWMDRAGTSAGNDGWNTGALSGERSSWSNFAASSSLPQPPGDPISSEGNDSRKGAEDTSWDIKSAPNQNSSWGAAGGFESSASVGWGKGEDSWNKASAKGGFDSGASGGWNKALAPSGGMEGSSKGAKDLGTGNWSAPGEENSAGWNQKSTENNEGDNDQGGWNSRKASNGSSLTECGQGDDGWRSGLSDQGNQKSSWGAWKCGSGEVQELAGIPADASNNVATSWEKNVGKKSEETWNQGKTTGENQNTGWKNRAPNEENQTSSWGRKGSEDTLKSLPEKSSDWIQGFDEKDKIDEGKNGDGWNHKETSGGTADGDSSWANKSSWNSGSTGSGGSNGNWGKKSNSISGFGGTKDVNKENKRDNWNSKKSADGGRTGWGENLGCKSVASDGANQDSAWGTSKPGTGNNESPWTKTSDGANQDSAWGTSKPGNATGNQESPWAKTSEKNQDTGWGKLSNWNSGAVDNKDRDGWSSRKISDEGPAGWGQNTAQKSRPNDGGNQDSNWESWKSGSSGVSSTWKSGSDTATGNQDSPWAKTSTWSSGSTDAGRSQDSNWGKKTDWKSGSGDANTSWGKKSNWLSGNASGDNQLIGGGGGGTEDQNDTSGNRASGGNWRGGYSGRGGGSDRGGFRGRGERGGFGGRGRSDRGGFGGRGGSDRGGFGGRGGSERGGFGGRGRGRRDQTGGWSNRNDFAEDKSCDWKKGADSNLEGWKNNSGSETWNQGNDDKKEWKTWSSGSGGSWNQGNDGKKEWKTWCSGSGGTSAQSGDQWSSWNKSVITEEVRGGSDGGEFGGRGGSERGGFGGRGRGRRDQTGGWNNRIDFAEDKSAGWKKGADTNLEGWKNNSGSKTWNQGNDGKKEWKSWSSGSGGTSGQSGSWNSKGSAWNSPTEAKEGSGWKKGSDSTHETLTGQGNNLSSSGDQWSSWNKTVVTEEVKGSSDQADGWKKGLSSSATGGGWGNQNSNCNGGTGSGDGGRTKDQDTTWNQSTVADRGQSSGWNQPKDAKDAKDETSGGAEPSGSWAAAGTSSWGKGKDSGGGW
ncbi:Transcription elongation factor Spt5 [Quillaja saponaria]|uniref:Transcription elongation factor Spt5 n=1 Tax=Quillaja saponaria TaxID=32244 RepID=A0AAD7VGU9_QUISA|nr:Transcription elongation factor Spt5 [Quillaja saponaria]